MALGHFFSYFTNVMLTEEAFDIEMFLIHHKVLGFNGVN